MRHTERESEADRRRKRWTDSKQRDRQTEAGRLTDRRLDRD